MASDKIEYNSILPITPGNVSDSNNICACGSFL
ncbi:hypothetical protein T02_13890 [Trichinella nativa]|uniref:Uncharacterized protein n=1 Tax=Trichinella nativa TaxID=6335 RepID=A0A0V1KJK2_9BILA|nr:hypothetical protein T02_13890 [Trichinella nativa]